LSKIPPTKKNKVVVVSVAAGQGDRMSFCKKCSQKHFFVKITELQKFPKFLSTFSAVHLCIRCDTQYGIVYILGAIFTDSSGCLGCVQINAPISAGFITIKWLGSCDGHCTQTNRCHYYKKFS
jgi:hypothetical protein